MRVRVHRGAKEIGGSCIEFEAAGRRVVLDLGRPLSAGKDEVVPLPDVPGLARGDDPSLLGVVISHAHQDHYGLLPAVAPTVPVFVGQAAERIVNEAAWFTGSSPVFRAAGHLRHLQPLVLGPFRITPYLADHSAFDAYSLLVEADGRRLFYTGDIRGDGRKARLFEALCARPPRDLHALLMEGTHIRASAQLPRRGLTEHQLEDELVDLCSRTTGPLLVAYSGQNIDRLVSLHRATRKAGRELVVDLYGATMGRATGNANIPQPGHDGLRVLVPQRQRVRILKEGCFERVNALGRSRIYARQMRQAGRFVVTLRPNVLRDLERTLDLRAGQVVWSMWEGYLAQESGRPTREFAERHGLPVTQLHASGHATVSDLQRLVAALAPEKVVPIHSEATSRFGEFFPRVERHEDGAWWNV